MAINCQAYALSLIESELFGYRGGSFTGAKAKGKTGKIENSAGGTLFLDEIGDLDLTIQVKLLRVLETRMIEPIGGSTAVPVDFRLICATNQDLTERIKAKLFRDDLYYRINTVRLDVPPLRERAEDILALAAHFLQRFSADQKKGLLRLSKAAEKRLLSHDWPGNIRELKNAVEAAVALTKNAVIDVAALRIDGTPTANCLGRQSFTEARADFERSFFQSHFEACDGSVAEMARRTGVDRKQIYKKLYEYGIVARSEPNGSDK